MLSRGCKKKMFLAYFTAKLLLLSTIVLKTTDSIEVRSLLKMEILNSGFHREINYNLRFSPVIGCDLLLVQDIPSSVYVDNDQLLNLNKLNKLKTFVNSYVDVEQPTSKSLPFKVFIFHQVRKTLNITLPVHFRYHEPSDRKFNRVEIESPKIFLANCNHKGRPVSLPCVNSTEITDLMDIASVSYCPWAETEIAPITLSFLIPVGNIQSYAFVLPVTIFISWIACLFLTYVIIKKSREINKQRKLL